MEITLLHNYAKEVADAIRSKKSVSYLINP